MQMYKADDENLNTLHGLKVVYFHNARTSVFFQSQSSVKENNCPRNKAFLHKTRLAMVQMQLAMASHQQKCCRYLHVGLISVALKSGLRFSPRKV